MSVAQLATVPSKHKQPTPAPVCPAVKQARQAVAKAKIRMMKSGSAFITSVCFSLQHVLTYEVERAATDGKRIFYNPDWILTLTKDHLVGVVAHETWHVCLNHCKLMLYSRMGDRDPKIWNIASDITINNLLYKARMSLPDPHIYEPQYEGWVTELIYDDLIANATQIQLEPGMEDLLDPPPGEGTDGDGEGQASNDEPPAMDPELERIILRANIAAQMAGEDPGHLPGELQFQIQKLVNPAMPWDRILVRYCRALAKTQYNFLIPNRRYFPKYYLPSKLGHALGRVDASIDLSASVSDAQVDQFIAEIASVLRRMKPKKLNLVEFDTQIRNVKSMRSPQDLLRHTFTGRGGTDIGPVIEHAEESQPDVMLIFTDGEFYHRHDTCSVPIVWIIFDNPGFTAPYGKIIHANLQKLQR